MARHAPGISPSELERMTPEESRYVQRRIVEDLDRESKMRLEYVKGIIRAMPRF